MLEIERKFLIKDVPALKAELDKLTQRPAVFEQGYLSQTPPVVRVRIMTLTLGTVNPFDLVKSFLTVKGEGTLERKEVEGEIAPHLARGLMNMAPIKLFKSRWRLGSWEIDYIPALDLWLAEIELRSPSEAFERPDWLGEEVTSDPVYTNVLLAERISRMSGGK